MESQAKIKFIRSTPRKARLVADAVRGKNVGEALSLLEFSIQRAIGQDIAKLIKSAVANLKNKDAELSIDVDTLKIKEIKVDTGPTMRRFRARAQGRYGRILKRMCHISVTISQ